MTDSILTVILVRTEDSLTKDHLSGDDNDD